MLIRLPKLNHLFDTERWKRFVDCLFVKNTETLFSSFTSTVHYDNDPNYSAKTGGSLYNHMKDSAVAKSLT